MATDPFTDAAESRLAVRLARKLELRAGGALGAAQLSILGITITWLPMFLLSLVEGRAFGSNVTISFLNDYLPHGRYLVALPLLVFLGVLLERRTASAIRHLSAAGLVRAADQDRFQSIVDTVSSISRGKVMLGVFVAVTYIVAAGSYLAIREIDVSNWMFTGSHDSARLSMAGKWSLFVSAPLVRLLFLRASWKFAVWVWFLVRLSRLNLDINAFHADRRCGLRFLGETQLAFTPLIAALGVQLGCVVALSVRFQGASLASHKLPGIAFVGLSVLLLVAPLSVFARRAWLERERAEGGFTVWSSLAARHMSVQLSESRSDYPPGLLTSSEISSMTDASALFDRVVETRPLAIDSRQIALILVAAVVPTLSPLLTLLPLAQIWRRLAEILL